MNKSLTNARRGASLILEISLGFVLILLVVLLVASLFPSSYQGSLQAARMNYATQLARQVLERQKRALPGQPVTTQTVDSPMTVQGRQVLCQFSYRVDLESIVNAQPVLWKVTVQWENAGGTKELVLVGASPVR
ncbi:MAG: hypothetical protein U0931_39755 [Vulcanimicrobiota bacterium]